MNFFPRIIAVAIVAGTASAASAVSVVATPGGLKEAVEAATDPATETSLTISGSMNAADFDFLRTMPALRSVDMSKVSVEAYSGAPTEMGLGTSAANALPDGALMSCKFTSLALPKDITSIGMGALGHSNVEVLQIPASVTAIGTKAFSNMPRLKKVVIPASVTSLGEGAFKDCPKLQSVEIRGDISAIPAGAFLNCPLLSEVTLPASVAAIDSAAFAGCSSLRSISLPEALRSVGTLAFAGTALESVNLHDAILLGDWAFAGCDNLTDIKAGSLTSIGRGAFFNDASLDMPVEQLAVSLTQLPDYIFYGAPHVDLSQLQTLHLTRIGAFALSGNQAMEATLPSSLTSLGDNAMERWNNLTTLYARNMADPPALGESVWEEIDQPSVELFVDASALEKFRDAPQWREFDVKAPSASDIIAPDADADHSVKASFDGMLLLVEATQDIRAAQLYDVAGRCFTIARNYQTNRLTLDTAPFDARVFILRLILADGSTPVLKIAR